MKFKSFIITIVIIYPSISLAQTPDELISWLPEIKEWKKPDSKEIFNPENLFDRINGAAPLFIENGFQEMTTFDYKKGDDYITFQIYRHATLEDAFGMYASERSFDLSFYKIGGEAHGDNSSLYFFAGPVYFKVNSSISTDESGEVMRKVGETLSERIATGTTYPTIINAFPSENKIPHSEAYITANYIGHDFLNKVFTCNYNKENLSYQLFIIDTGSSNSAKEILNKYLNFSKQSIDLKEGEILIKDRYNGDIPCLWKGKYIIGIYNENGQTVPDSDSIIRSVSL